MLVISRYARRDHVDHNLSDQASIVNFIEYNWRLPGIPGSADQILAGLDQQEGIPFDLAGMFDFQNQANSKLILDPSTGQPVHPVAPLYLCARCARRSSAPPSAATSTPSTN